MAKEVRVFQSDDELIVVAVASGKPMDNDGTLFGPESGRKLEDYDDLGSVDFESGGVLTVHSHMRQRIYPPS